MVYVTRLQKYIFRFLFLKKLHCHILNYFYSHKYVISSNNRDYFCKSNSVDKQKMFQFFSFFRIPIN